MALTEKDKYTFALAWFTTHAQQRMQLLNYWFVAVSFLTTSSILAASASHLAVAKIIDSALIIASVLFYGLDVRTQELIAYGERAMSAIEQRSNSEGDSTDSFRLADGMHLQNRRAPAYRWLFAALYWGAALMGTLLLALHLSAN